jgi:hypothetical protein
MKGNRREGEALPTRPATSGRTRQRGMVMRRPFTPAKNAGERSLSFGSGTGSSPVFTGKLLQSKSVHGEITTVEKRSQGDYYRATTLTTCEKGPWSNWVSDPTGEGLGSGRDIKKAGETSRLPDIGSPACFRRPSPGGRDIKKAGETSRRRERRRKPGDMQAHQPGFTAWSSEQDQETV